MIDAASIEQLEARFGEDVAAATSERAVIDVRDRYVGRKSGAISALLKSVAAAPPDQRRELGRIVNELKARVETRIQEALAAARASVLPAGAVDVTLPGRRCQ